MSVKVDGVAAGKRVFQVDPNGARTNRAQSARLARGVHTITVANGELPVTFYSLTVEQTQNEPSAEKKALHYRLFGMEPGEAALDPRLGARRLLAGVVSKTLHRPPGAGRKGRLLFV